MSWQDIVVGIVQVVFLIALIPSLRSNDKPAFWTSMLTGMCMLVLAFVYATVLWITSAIIALIMGYCWFVLAVQVYVRKHHA